MKPTSNVTPASAAALFAASCLASLVPAFARSEEQARFPVFTTAARSKVPCGHCAAPSQLASEAEIAPDKEPGDRLVISGTIYRADGRTPAPDIVLFAYQTDTAGYYNKEDDAFNPRLRGWVKSDKNGRYAFRTIRPGAYPHRNTPGHIHVHLYGPGIPEHSIEEYRFSDDTRLSEKEREEARSKARILLSSQSLAEAMGPGREYATLSSHRTSVDVQTSNPYGGRQASLGIEFVF